ncbi:hypothetical protein TEQG_06707 [Trichophyton equinum CBS 127.97]|uniref:Uncharacterized protein n=1 Tax=Trichophyton equinum (strain ATCC MYA-4606 / CBS 127.97) TaxID=559882 RepID=F2Q0Q6_TRIEC|nr:hypothetical protein TEQG_06707 [Trichophyton equinum CBS 127.97]
MVAVQFAAVQQRSWMVIIESIYRKSVIPRAPAGCSNCYFLLENSILFGHTVKRARNATVREDEGEKEPQRGILSEGSGSSGQAELKSPSTGQLDRRARAC